MNIPVLINSQRTIIITDSGATNNFASQDLIRLLGLSTRRKKGQYNLQIADGLTLLIGRIDKEIYLLPIII